MIRPPPNTKFLCYFTKKFRQIFFEILIYFPFLPSGLVSQNFFLIPFARTFKRILNNKSMPETCHLLHSHTGTHSQRQVLAKLDHFGCDS